MKFVGYCPICGNTDLGIEQDKEHKCSYCNHETIITKYSLEEYFKDMVKIREHLKEYAKSSPEFDEELARKREEEEDKVIHGKGSYVSTQSKNVPQCPTCGSTNINKISTTKKAAGFLAVGVFSSNLGKTMECKNCGYKW